MFLPKPRTPLSAAEIGLLHKVDHVLTVAIEMELEQALSETRPIMPVPDPRTRYTRQTGSLHLPQTGPLSQTGPMRAQ